MNINIRNFKKHDVSEMMNIWNEVVEAGNAFPQINKLTEEEAYDFFKSQSASVVAEVNGEIVGLYILHPNNVGRCSHIANSSYAVKASERGKNIGEELVKDSLVRGKELGFKILQFNAVVASNKAAIKLYEKLGFVKLGTVKEGYLNKNSIYEDIILFYHNL